MLGVSRRVCKVAASTPRRSFSTEAQRKVLATYKKPKKIVQDLPDLGPTPPGQISPRYKGSTPWKIEPGPFHKYIKFPKETFTMVKCPDETQVCFRVPLKYNKPQIKNYLEQIYGVKILNVRTMILLKKPRRIGSTSVRRKDIKKAYVRVEGGFEFPRIKVADKLSPPK